ncbi:hypothetical protein G9Q38_07120 [Pusillimonas sp. DMV24BSW_D]|uniref:hypothetical protein n=1 Tax=Neopusillimonas aestuarii TaxID=2716226 RepID=UPI00140AEA00|nr:hypothetical protein [Pusillimonas sp. DMV24BSW_D]QIM48966.1 hypothetical protein G9Q38_07120 [Pusillimonas sp. DMV24BSW_D]
MTDMSDFRITFDGPALETSQMDVQELAPALLAVGDLLSASTQALCGEKVRPQVNVKGSFKTGSFGIDFSLITDLLTKMRDIFASDGAAAVANASSILALLGISASAGRKGLLQVLGWLKGRQIQRVEAKENTAILHVDNDQLEIELAVLRLLRDMAVREATERMLEPLTKEGVNKFYAGTESKASATISSDEVSWYSAPQAQDDLLVDETRKMVFSIVSLAFKEDNKWRLHDGNSTISASIADADFQHKVDMNQISFAKGDVLVCDVRVRQWQSTSGAKTEYEVIRVLEHRTGARQIPFPGL